MLSHTKQSIHFGVGCVFAPQPAFDAAHALAFQSALRDHGIEFTAANTPPGMIQLLRAAPPLEIRLQQPGPPVGSLAVVATPPQRTIDAFIDDARTVFDEFQTAWPGPVQILQREVTTRYLYDVAGGDSFAFLWVRRLGRTQDELKALGDDVRGGGLRVVIGPTEMPSELPQIEVKIESFFADPRKLFLEVQMKWLPPTSMEELDIGALVKQTDDFADKELARFINDGG